MGKGLNNAVAKNGLRKGIKEAFDRMEKSRWLATPEGQAHLQEEARKRENIQMHQMLNVGQLAWKEDVQDDPTLLTSGKLVNRCHKIVKINDDSVTVEMMYAVIDNEHLDTYTSWFDVLWEKGQQFDVAFYQLERHISQKSGLTWWKIN